MNSRVGQGHRRLSPEAMLPWRWLLWVAWCGIGLLGASHPLDGLPLWLGQLGLLVAVTGPGRSLARGASWALAGLGGVGALQWGFGLLGGTPGLPPSSLLGHPNFAAEAALGLLPLTGLAAFRGHGVGWLGLLAGGFLVVACRSRGAMVGLGAALALGAMARAPRRIQGGLLMGLIGMGIGGTALWSGSPGATFRLETWRQTLTMVTDAPMVGVGLGHFGHAYHRYRQPEEIRLHPPNHRIAHPHNQPLEILAETGAIGLLLWLLAHGSLLASLWLRKTADASASLMGIVALHVAGLYSFPLATPGGWLVFALLVIQSRPRDQEAPPPLPWKAFASAVIILGASVAGLQGISRWRAASGDFAGAVALWPGNHPARYRLAVAHLRGQRYGQAAAVAAPLPVSPSNRHLQATIADASGDNAEAIQLARQALALDPTRGDTGALLLASMLEAGRCKEGLTEARTLTEQGLRGALFFFNTGALALECGREASALQAFLAALEERHAIDHSPSDRGYFAKAGGAAYRFRPMDALGNAITPFGPWTNWDGQAVRLPRQPCAAAWEAEVRYGRTAERLVFERDGTPYREALQWARWLARDDEGLLRSLESAHGCLDPRGEERHNTCFDKE